MFGVGLTLVDFLLLVEQSKFSFSFNQEHYERLLALFD